MKEYEFAKLRDSARLRDINEFIYATTSLLALPLYLVFWLADLLYAPERKWEFLFLRVFIIPVCLFTNRFIRRCRNHNDAQLITSLFIACNSAILNMMIFCTRGPSSEYYAGLNLVGTVLLYMPLTKKFIILNTFLLYGPFFFFGLMAKNVNWTAFLLNSFFIGAFLVIAIVIRMFLERLRSSEIVAKFQLGEELSRRETIIKQKTQEALELTSLAKQFSPQVVQSVYSGRLNLDSELLTNIGVIFIDIVGSTKKIRTIPLDNFNKIIDMFTADSMKVLLKHDITIDKFMGDGIMAISNAPVVRADHVNRIANASLELRERLQDKSLEYENLWGEPFKFRGGIALGEARVGFIGQTEVFKSYTAIGDVVNLASRLCDSARPNEILISKKIAEELSQDDYIMQRSEPLSLKGFDDEACTAFSLQGRNEGDLCIPKEIGMCPHGHGVLHLDTNDQGLFEFVCRVCGYIEKGTKDKQLKHAA